MLDLLKFIFLGKGNVKENQIVDEEAGLLQIMHDEFYEKIKHIDPNVEIEMISSDEGKCVDRVVARYLGVPMEFISAKLDDYRQFSENIRPWMPSIIRNSVNLCKINSLFQIPFGVFEEEDQSIRRLFAETAKTMAISYMGHMWLVHFSRQFDFLETTKCTSIAGGDFNMSFFDFEEGLVLENPRDVKLARFLNSQEFINHLCEHTGKVMSLEEIKKIAFEFNDFKDFFFEEHKLTEEYYGNDFKTPIRDACKIKLNMDPTKGFLTIRKLHGPGWNAVVYYFQFVYEDVKVIQKGTTDIYQALAWLKHYKYRSFSVKSDEAIKGVHIGGKFWLIDELSCETALVATTSRPFVFEDAPMELYRESRVDLLIEKSDPLFVEYTLEELDEIKLKAHLKYEQKRKSLKVNLENIVTQVFTLERDMLKVEGQVNFLHKKMKEQGIVTTNEIVWVNSLEDVNTENPINFLLYKSFKLELKALQLRELAKGRLLICVDVNHLWKYFELGSQYHVFNQLKLLQFLYDEIDMSPILTHYLWKYKFSKFENYKAVGFRIRTHIIVNDTFDLDLFAFKDGRLYLNKKIKKIQENLDELKKKDFSSKFNYVMSLYKFSFVS